MKNIENYEQNHTPFSQRELLEIINKVNKQIFDLWDENIDDKQNNEKEQEIIKQLTEQLELEKHRFKNIFETSRGSKYFILQDGSSLRIKCETRDDKEKIYKIQPMTNKIFYIDKKEFQKISNMKNLDYLIGQPISKVLPVVGSYPVEINLIDLPTETIFEENDETITLLGSRYKEYPKEPFDKQLYGGFHLGNCIVKIIK